MTSTTRSPNVSNVFSHIRPLHTPSPSYRIKPVDDWEEEDEEPKHHVSEHFKRYELMTEL